MKNAMIVANMFFLFCKRFLLGVSVFIVSNISVGSSIMCQPLIKKDSNNKQLVDYIKEKNSTSYKIISDKVDRYYQVRVIRLKINTVIWPNKEATIMTDHSQWEHNVSLFIPKKVAHDTALLYLDSGVLHPKGIKYFPLAINAFSIAKKTNSIVIEVRDLPNQALRFTKKLDATNKIANPEDSVEKKGSKLVVYSFEKFIEDPYRNKYLPLLFPMVKAITQIMTECQNFLTQQQLTINKFVVSGYSKRGWATWMAATVDKRICAIIPIVSDFFYIDKLLKLNRNTKIMLGNLNKEMLSNQGKKEDAVNQLIQIIDLSQYIENINVPIFNVSCLNDEIFPANHHLSYLNKLNSNYYLRSVSRCGHFINKERPSVINASVCAFYGSLISERKLPEIKYKIEKDKLIVTTTEQDRIKKIVLRTTVSYDELFMKKMNKSVNFLKFLSYDKKNKQITVRLKNRHNLYSAYTIEITYKNKPFNDLILTTPVIVLPRISY
jgi:PhoPQ-activated pathogenicity-related protein